MELGSRADAISYLLRRDGDACYLCDYPLDDDVTIDHVVPKSRGGTWDSSNLKLAHFKCNQDKADRLFLDDGVLEPKNGRPPRLHKSQRPVLCEECHNGRMLPAGTYCDVCGSEAGPERFPHYAKRIPRECSHDHSTWCWMCGSGIVSRKAPYIYI
jgi:HNH endonuclease